MRLGAFVSALCHFIATALGEENMMRLKDDSGLPDAFISTPRPTKEMFDIVQDAHRLTLSCCIVIESPKAHAQDAYPGEKVTEIYNKVTESDKKVTELQNSLWIVL